jgi:uncharacterized protein DUF4062
MEFFPSTGRGQWDIIEDSLAAADFCIFVVGGRYGTISDDGALSWTHREFRAARDGGKPLVGILHADPSRLPPDRREQAQRGRDSLAAFRREVESATICSYYHDAADLVQAVASAIGALKEEQRIDGWVPAGRRPVVLKESDFDRVYELVEASWRYKRSITDPATWDGYYLARRVLLGQDPEGLASCTVDFTRDTDRYLPFDSSRRPVLKLSAQERSRGRLHLRPPRKTTGGNFVQDVMFSPPLANDERASFTLDGYFPSYRHAWREDLVAATTDGRMGPRIYDWTSRNVVYPTRALRISAFLPRELGAIPLGPKIGRSASTIDRQLSNLAASDGSYTCEEVDSGDGLGDLMTLCVSDPSIRRHYRLAWELPARPDTQRSTRADTAAPRNARRRKGSEHVQ